MVKADMWQRPVIVISVLAVTIGACTTARSAPATAPPTSAARTTTTASTTTTTAPDTTMSEATTTTVDLVAEITAIFEDLERRRLEAIAAGDREAFRKAYANLQFFEESLLAFESAEVIDPAGFETTEVLVIVDTGTCVAAAVTRAYGGALVGGGLSERTIAIELVDGEWGYSWIGEGWLCEGPHPLGS